MIVAYFLIDCLFISVLIFLKFNIQLLFLLYHILTYLQEVPYKREFQLTRAFPGPKMCVTRGPAVYHSIVRGLFLYSSLIVPISVPYTYKVHMCTYLHMQQFPRKKQLKQQKDKVFNYLEVMWGHDLKLEANHSQNHGIPLSSRLTATFNLCLIYFKITLALVILLEHIHKKFEGKSHKD